MSEILVLAEHRQGVLRDVTFEMLGLARGLAREAGWTVSALVLGAEPGEPAAKLATLADRVLLVQDGELGDYDAECYLPAVQSVLARRRPALILVGHTAQGMDLAPALGARLGLPLVTDCLALRRAADGFVAVRQIYGGKLNAELTLKPAASVLATVRPGCFPGAPQADRSAEQEALAAPTWEGRRARRLLGYAGATAEDVDVAAADILVSVGRGVGKPENMSAVQAFADAIGATLCCSRPVADKGWLPKSRQVGTSGKVVRPKLYLAFGISGAYQHVAGMRNAETIIAVNRDPAAPIFEVAHYGIVGDMFEVLPQLQQRLTSG